MSRSRGPPKRLGHGTAESDAQRFGPKPSFARSLRYCSCVMPFQSGFGVAAGAGCAGSGLEQVLQVFDLPQVGDGFLRREHGLLPLLVGLDDTDHLLAVDLDQLRGWQQVGQELERVVAPPSSAARVSSRLIVASAWSRSNFVALSSASAALCCNLSRFSDIQNSPVRGKGVCAAGAPLAGRAQNRSITQFLDADVPILDDVAATPQNVGEISFSQVARAVVPLIPLVNVVFQTVDAAGFFPAECSRGPSVRLFAERAFCPIRWQAARKQIAVARRTAVRSALVRQALQGVWRYVASRRVARASISWMVPFISE